MSSTPVQESIAAMFSETFNCNNNDIEKILLAILDNRSRAHAENVKILDKVNELSKKIDQTLGVAKPSTRKAPKKTEAAKPKEKKGTQEMAYFIHKFTDNRNAFDEILSADDIVGLIDENQEHLPADDADSYINSVAQLVWINLILNDEIALLAVTTMASQEANDDEDIPVVAEKKSSKSKPAKEKPAAKEKPPAKSKSKSKSTKPVEQAEPTEPSEPAEPAEPAEPIEKKSKKPKSKAVAKPAVEKESKKKSKTKLVAPTEEASDEEPVIDSKKSKVKPAVKKESKKSKLAPVPESADEDTTEDVEIAIEAEEVSSATESDEEVKPKKKLSRH